MSIVNFSGAELLKTENLAAIKKEADLILQNRDVAAAWQASRHIKIQLATLPGDQVKALLPDYRRLTANLKALSLPLLGWDEVKNLLTNNLAFLDSKYLPVLSAGLSAWLSTQTDAEKGARSNEILKLLPNDSPLRAGLAVQSAPLPTLASLPVKISDHAGLFDKEESRELASHAQKVAEIGGAPLAISGGATVAENIFNLSASNEDKETFLRRANALINSRLRDVRTKAELLGYLGRPFMVGGLGLSAEALEKGSALIEDEYNKLHSHTPVMPSAPIAADKAVAVTEAPLPPSVAPRPAIKEDKPMAPPPPQKEAVKIKPAIEPVVLKIEPAPAPKAVTVPVPDASRVMRPSRIAPANDKPRVEDIKSSPRTVSAVDELKFLTLEDWRKYGTPDEAMKNILQKIQLFGQESVGNKVQGIKMFHDSELFQQYVALGRATLAQGKKLTDALADKTVNPGQMTQDEFFAIALLNGKLK